ncbi:MAG TPA: CBS domain-containing protein, partial [Acidimicrobiia bacterium]|nr:CBS domain-containing protein [Acidimicrobiia bacterium]
MPERVDEVMTPDPYTLGPEATLAEAARIMRDADIGDVVVTNADGQVAGILTDRDIVVRALADDRDPTDTVESAWTQDVVSVSSRSAVAEAVSLMRQHNIRRLPVVDDGALVGIVSLGDLAV